MISTGPTYYNTFVNPNQGLNRSPSMNGGQFNQGSGQINSLPSFTSARNAQDAVNIANQYDQAAGIQNYNNSYITDYWNKFGANDPGYLQTRVLNGMAQAGGNMSPWQSLESPTAGGGWGPGTAGWGPDTPNNSQYAMQSTGPQYANNAQSVANWRGMQQMRQNQQPMYNNSGMNPYLGMSGYSNYGMNQLPGMNQNYNMQQGNPFFSSLAPSLYSSMLNNPALYGSAGTPGPNNPNYYSYYDPNSGQTKYAQNGTMHTM